MSLENIKTIFANDQMCRLKQWKLVLQEMSRVHDNKLSDVLQYVIHRVENWTTTPKFLPAKYWSLLLNEGFFNKCLYDLDDRAEDVVKTHNKIIKDDTPFYILDSADIMPFGVANMLALDMGRITEYERGKDWYFTRLMHSQSLENVGYALILDEQSFCKIPSSHMDVSEWRKLYDSQTQTFAPEITWFDDRAWSVIKALEQVGQVSGLQFLDPLHPLCSGEYGGFSVQKKGVGWQLIQAELETLEAADLPTEDLQVLIIYSNPNSRCLPPYL